METAREQEKVEFKLATLFPRILRLLTPREKAKAAILVLCTLLNSFLEILGLTAILPVIAVVSNPGILEENEVLKALFDFGTSLGASDINTFSALLAGCLLCLFILKAAVNLVIMLFQVRYSFDVGHRLSGEMWKHHFTCSLEHMRSQESGQILEEINAWPLTFAGAYLTGSLQLISESIVITCIGLGLVFFNPMVFLSVSCLLAIGALIIQKFTKWRLSLYNDIQREVKPQTNTMITSTLQGFLEIISFGAAEAIRRRYLAQTKLLYRINGNSTVLNLTPAKLYEVLAVGAVTGIILITLVFPSMKSELLGMLSVMVVAAYRVMPSMTRINNQLMSMRRFHFALESLERMAHNTGSVVLEHNPKDIQIPDSVSIELNDLQIKYASANAPVISGLSFRFESSKIHAIVGPSGAGKSTLVNAILGLIPVEKGNVTASNVTHPSTATQSHQNQHSWLANIAYLSQKPFLFKGKVRENLTLGNPDIVIDEARTVQLLGRLELLSLFGGAGLDFELLEGGGNLSGGQQQRLALLRALQVKRPVLILDEATSALDSAMRDVVFELLREQANDGATVILVTHDKELASKCDDVLDLG